MNWSSLRVWLELLCFGYPYAMAWYWMIGGVLFHLLRERKEPRFDMPPPLAQHPPVSVLVPCHNEAQQIAETLAALDASTYPDFEIIAIDDGSTDGSSALLDELATRYPRLRVVHLDRNRGKGAALNFGATTARSELLLCIDGDTLLDPHAITWVVRRFQNDPRIGGVTGNPRIRNRSTLVGRLQVGEFSAIVGLIKRAQRIYGSLFTASGAISAYRKRALHDAGWWSPHTVTEDVDISWRLQMTGWQMAFEPKALAWILTPETVRGLWRQRLRWAEGGAGVALRATPQLLRGHGARMWPLWLNWLVSVMWAYAMLLVIALGLVDTWNVGRFMGLRGIGFLPGQFGMVLAFYYLLQALVAVALDRRYEYGMMRALFWVVWYPLVFWTLQAATAVVGLPLALMRGDKGRWTSPDRGFR
ncbi:poly-beta-1,6-N-acetyl-D-glucosamine synthase [Lysobacter panacisoli]|uniref:Poly-beta-1,6-N-acetyl-D-glucosamine synthase n=1 Tax=Lysobacter panacisoli TaxID=1255263 RepID=A0ABP9LHE9_9GAMM|nr:poly-beta-1,6-N-acetyl-D-glucosamine synthase [Lysobacter panacisoli]